MLFKFIELVLLKIFFFLKYFSFLVLKLFGINILVVFLVLIVFLLYEVEIIGNVIEMLVEIKSIFFNCFFII